MFFFLFPFFIHYILFSSSLNIEIVIFSITLLSSSFLFLIFYFSFYSFSFSLIRLFFFSPFFLFFYFPFFYFRLFFCLYLFPFFIFLFYFHPYLHQMPPIATTILPHPKSLNNITLLNFMKETKSTSVAKFLCTDIRYVFRAFSSIVFTLLLIIYF